MKKFKKNSCKFSKGFSLTEVLLSAGILAIGLGIAIFALVKGLQGTDMQYVSVQAREFAHARLERIRAGWHPENDGETIEFSQIKETSANNGYHRTYFEIDDAHGNQYLGQTEVNIRNSNPELLLIDAYVCVRLKDGKIIGNNQGWVDSGPTIFKSPFCLQTAIVDTSP